MNTIRRYHPFSSFGVTRVSQVRILLIGQVGSGKSSFFNTVNSIFRGYISGQANAGSAEHSLTTSYRTYQVRDGYGGKPLSFRLCDTRGLEDNQGLDEHQIGYLLDGHVPDKYQFNPAWPISADDPCFIASPPLADRIHCVAFIIDGSTMDAMSNKVLERMKSAMSKINVREIPQVVILTKIDQICDDVSQNITNVCHSQKIKECVDKIAMAMGLPRSHVLPIKNYESELLLDTNTNILALVALRHMLRLADDYLYNHDVYMAPSTGAKCWILSGVFIAVSCFVGAALFYAN